MPITTGLLAQTFSKLDQFDRALTNEADGFAAELEASLPAHVFTAAAGRPKTNAIFDTEEKDEDDFHVEQDLVGTLRVAIDRRQHTEY